jgi:putative endonuclease
MSYFVYILANKPHGTLYVGVTNDLVRRVYEHRENIVPGFTRRHQVHRLVYFEATEGFAGALSREKQLKKWRRDWKIELIESNNPHWEYLYPAIAEPSIK